MKITFCDNMIKLEVIFKVKYVRKKDILNDYFCVGFIKSRSGDGVGGKNKVNEKSL